MSQTTSWGTRGTSVYGASEGEVNGAFRMVVEGTDATGTVFNEHLDAKTFTSNWASQTMRMRPHPNATEFTIRVSLDIDSTSTVGSLFIDSFVLRAIRPHMDWVNGPLPTPPSPQEAARLIGAQATVNPSSLTCSKTVSLA